MGLNTTPRTWVVSEVVTAAELNTEIRDALTGLQAAYASWTPALTATTTNPTMGTGSSVTGTYLQVGKHITGTLEIVAGTSGFVAGSGTYRISLPVAQVAAATTNGRVIGDGFFFDSSTSTFYHLMAVAASSTTASLVLDVAGTMSAVAPVVSANNDQWRLKLDYQAA